MAIGNLDSLSASLAKMTPQQRQQYAAMHKNDPMIVALAKFINDAEQQKAQALRGAQMGQQGQPPKVVDQAIAGMAQQLPENTGIGALPAPNMQAMADGGIAGYAEGGEIESYARGGRSGLPDFDAVLDAEGVTDPTERAFLKSIYAQESGSGRNTKTSNRGAVGPMQILPGTFKSVADKGMDINNPVDNLRAGIRYGRQGFQAAGGDPALAGAFYYGGPGGLAKARDGVAVSDPKNPGAPTTLTYGQQVAQRMTDLMPIGSANAAPAAPAASAAPATSAAPSEDRMAALYSQYVPRRPTQPQSFTGMMPPPAGPSLNAFASRKEASMTPTAQLNNIAVQETARRSGIAAALPPDQQVPFVRRAAPAELSTGTVTQQAPEPPVNQDDGSYDRAEAKRLARLMPPEVKKDLVETAKESVTDKKATKGFTGEDWLMLGLGLLQSKSPYFGQALGEAGMGAMKARRERAKDERDAASDAIKDKYMAALGRQADAVAGSYGDGSRLLPQALKAGNDAFDDWAKSMEGMTASAEVREAKRQEFIQAALAQFKIAGQTGGVTLPKGVVVNRLQ